MTDPAPQPAKPRALSLFLWISGLILWLIVGALFFINYRSDERSPVADGKQRPVITPANSSAGLVEPSSAWDPQGIGDFSFTERSGETVTKNDLLGTPWIVGFVFTRCAGPCPRVSGQMAMLQKHFADDDVRLVTMTVDPDYDTPEVLQRYATAFGADEKKWLFLTGDKETMYRYIEQHFKMPVEEMQGADRKPGFEVLHTTNLLLIDSKGVVRGKYNAVMPDEMAKLRKDVERLDS